MKLLLSLSLLLPLNSFAADIPVDGFDQAKLLWLLKRMPQALVRTEDRGSFIRRHYRFPDRPADFYFDCTADYYQGSAIPSEQHCLTRMEASARRQGDEYVLEVTDHAVAGPLWKAIPYGKEEKSFYATERVFGRGFDGRNRQLFRYAFICSPASCRLTFSTAK
jgi:hypothetical protein